MKIVSAIKVRIVLPSITKKKISKGIDNVAMLNKVADFDVKNKVVVEIGTGAHAIDCRI